MLKAEQGNPPHDDLKRRREIFYKTLYIDITINAVAKSPKEKHPRTEFAVHGGNSWDRVSVSYGKDPSKPQRTQVYHQDNDEQGKTLQAKFLEVPMPTPEERFLWIDLTYGIRGIYLPICYDAGLPYNNMCKFLRLDFKHRCVRLPFARSFDRKLYRAPERDLLDAETDKARLEIKPDRLLVDGEKLHPILQNTKQYRLENLISAEQAKSSPEAAKAREEMKQWLERCQGAGSEEEKNQARDLDALAAKLGVQERDPQYYRAEVDREDILRRAQTDDAFNEPLQELLPKWVSEFIKTKKDDFLKIDKKFDDNWINKSAKEIGSCIASRKEFQPVTRRSLVQQPADQYRKFADSLSAAFGEEFERLTREALDNLPKERAKKLSRS